MTDENNNFDFVCVDTASSRDGCPTPSTTMSEDIPIRSREEDTPKTEDDTNQNEEDILYNEEDIPYHEEDTSGSKPGKAKVKSTSQEDTTKAGENESPNINHAKTEEANPSHDNVAPHMEHHPRQDRNCMIQEHQHPHRILGLQTGELKPLDAPRLEYGVSWSCHEKGNWLGFCNTTSGTYLGYDEAGKVIATESTHKVRENFVAIRQESGGYILHTFHTEGELQQVAITEDGTGLTVQEKGGTAWDFIDADYVAYSVTLFPDMKGKRQRLF